ncbi:MAG: hypothetical protein GY856_11930, partial [bacterium]|nr:hypothetical protein [bacterium]
MPIDQDSPATAPDDTVSLDKVLRTLARHFLKDLVEILFPDLAPELDLTAPEFLNGKLFANFRKKGHVRPDVVVKLRARSGEPQFAVFHGEFEGEYRQVIEKRLKMYFHQLALEYDDPPVITAAIFKTGRVCGIEKREVVREVGSWVSNRFYYLAFGLSRSLAEQYVNRPQPLAAALAALMGSELWDRVEQKLQCL